MIDKQAQETILKQSLQVGWLLVGAGATLAAHTGLLILDRTAGTLRGGSVPVTIGWFLLAFIGYLVIVIQVENRRPTSLRWFWLLAIVTRLLLAGTSPTLSTDVYRYLWEGHVAVNGISPYAHVVEAPELDALDHPIRALVNNTWIASPYLPAAQALFWITAYWLPLTPLTMQILMVFFDLLTAVLIGQLLRLVGLPKRRLLLYLLNPLVIVEVAHSAHVDAWMILLTMTAVWAMLAPLGRKHDWLAPVLLAMAICTKPLPLLLAPAFFRRWKWHQRILCILGVVLLLVPAGWRAGWGLWGELDGTGLFGTLRIMLRQWQFNSGVFRWLADVLNAAGLSNSARWAGAFTGLVLAASLAVIWWRDRDSQQTLTWLRWLSLPLAATLLLSTTAQPWYFLIMLAFLPFWPPAAGEGNERWLAALPWIWISGTLVFSYLSYSDPSGFRELGWVRALEWGPTWLLLGLYLFISYRIPGVKHANGP